MMRSLVPASCILLCLSGTCLAQRTTTSARPEPSGHYQADVTCASMALAVKKDSEAMPAAAADDASQIDYVVAETSKAAIVSGQTISKQPTQVTADIGTGSVPLLKNLRATHGTDQYKEEQRKLGRALIACAVTHASEAMTPAGK